MKSITASDLRSLIRLASTLPKGSPERKAILAGLIKVGGKAGDFKVGDIVRHTGKFLRNTGMAVGAPIDGKVVEVYSKGYFAGHPVVQWSNGGIESVVLAENIQHVRGGRRASGPVSHQDLDILAGEIIGYAYEGEGPEPGDSGLRYLAQDNGAIWEAAEEAGFESDDLALEHFMELSDNDRFRILKRNR